jgi:uncharacterized protein YcfL
VLTNPKEGVVTVKFSVKAVVFALMALLVGCAAPTQANGVVDRDELNVDPEVRYAITVTELFQEQIRQPDGTSILQVQFAVEVLNDANLAWKVDWFNSEGMKVKGVGEGYRTASVLAGQNRYFKATAPHPRVVSYQIHIREPK